MGRPSWADEREPAPTANPIGIFDRILAEHTGRYITKWSQYGGVYDREFGGFRQNAGSLVARPHPIHFLEIGVKEGGSLEVWRKFFGADARIVGIDIDERCAELSSDDLPVRIGSQTDASFMRSVATELGGLDIVLDDGSHRANHQRSTFATLFPLLSDGGLYVVEDTHTSYWMGHGGGFRRPGSFVEFAKRLVDGMHGWYFMSPDRRLTRWARHDVESVRFYDSIVVIEKRHRTDHPIALESGGKGSIGANPNS